MKCFKCGSEKTVKNGRVFGWQRYRCKSCGYQFTKTAPAGKPIHLKMAVHDLYAYGLSMRKIAEIIGVSPQSVSRWINKWHPAYVSEVGQKGMLSETPAADLLKTLAVRQNETLLTSSVSLPGGARFSLVIQLPSVKKSLKK